VVTAERPRNLAEWRAAAISSGVAEPLTDAELSWMLVRLERAVHETAAGFMRGMIMVSGLFFVMGAAFAVQGAWGIAGFIALFGAGMVALGIVASRKNAPEKLRPVADAVRDAPERIVILRHYQTSDSRRIFVTDWLELKTGEHRMVVKAKQEWQQLLGLLERRCPNAKVTR
jgi:hypothetical protein